MTIGIVLSLIILMCGISEYFRLQVIAAGVREAWRMLSFPQSMIIMQVCIMESGRDILAAMFFGEGSWEEDLNEGDIYDYLDETIGTNCLAAGM